MFEYNEFITRTVIDYVNLNNIIKKQECQIEVMKTKNNELQMLVGFLKDKLIEFDPSMKSQFEALNL